MIKVEDFVLLGVVTKDVYQSSVFPAIDCEIRRPEAIFFEEGMYHAEFQVFPPRKVGVD